LPGVPRFSAPVHRVLVVLAAVVVLAGCQVKLTVDTKVQADGSGTVTVGVGLDDEALAKVGDLNSQLRVDDLRSAGWTITGPAKEADGFTWVRAAKPFADPAAAAKVMDEVNGADGAFRGWQVQRSSNPLSTSYSAKGTIDLTKGLATFGDTQLAQLLGGDPFAEAVKKLEAEQGRPISDQVDVQVTVEVPGATHTYRPTLADAQPTAVAVSGTSINWGGLAMAGAVAGLAAGLVLVILLRRRAVRRRRRGGRTIVRH
jgi:hypothetical protein